MSHLYYIPRENGLNHHIPHPVMAIIGAVLGLFGMLASGAKLVVPLAVVNLEPAYQVLGFMAAVCVTGYNLYCMKQIMDARTAKQIADIAAGKAARAVAAMVTDQVATAIRLSDDDTPAYPGPGK